MKIVLVEMRRKKNKIDNKLWWLSYDGRIYVLLLFIIYLIRDIFKHE